MANAPVPDPRAPRPKVSSALFEPAPRAWLARTARALARHLASLPPGTLEGAGPWRLSRYHARPHHVCFLAERDGAAYRVKRFTLKNDPFSFGPAHEHRALALLDGVGAPRARHFHPAPYRVGGPVLVEDAPAGTPRKNLSRTDLYNLALAFSFLHRHRFRTAGALSGARAPQTLAERLARFARAGSLYLSHPVFRVHVDTARALLKRHAPAFAFPGPFALLHQNPSPDNLLFPDKGPPRFLDFYFSRAGDPAEDLAAFFALRAVHAPDRPLSEKDRQRLLAAYVSRTRDPAVLARVPLYEPFHLLFAALRFTHRLEHAARFSRYLDTAAYATRAAEAVDAALAALSEKGFQKATDAAARLQAP